MPRINVAHLIMSGLLAAFAAISAQGAGTVEEHPTMTKQIIAVEHVRIECGEVIRQCPCRARAHPASARSQPAYGSCCRRHRTDSREKREGQRGSRSSWSAITR